MFLINLNIFFTDPFRDINDPETIREFLYKPKDFTLESSFKLNLPRDLKTIEEMVKTQPVLTDFFKNILSKKEYYDWFTSLYEKNDNYDIIDSFFSCIRQTNPSAQGILATLGFAKAYKNQTVKGLMANFVSIKKKMETYAKSRIFQEDFAKFRDTYYIHLENLSSLDKELVIKVIDESEYLKEHSTIKQSIKEFQEELGKPFFNNINSYLKNFAGIFRVKSLQCLMLDQIQLFLDGNKLLSAYKKLDTNLTDITPNLDVKPLEKLREIL